MPLEAFQVLLTCLAYYIFAAAEDIQTGRQLIQLGSVSNSGHADTLSVVNGCRTYILLSNSDIPDTGIFGHIDIFVINSTHKRH